jgi:hypothetical protein
MIENIVIKFSAIEVEIQNIPNDIWNPKNNTRRMDDLNFLSIFLLNIKFRRNMIRVKVIT